MIKLPKHVTQEYNLEAEKIVIQTMLLDDGIGENALELFEIVTPVHFGHNQTRILAETIRRLLVQGKLLDPLHMQTELIETGKMDDLGGPGVLLDYYNLDSFVLFDSAKSAANMVKESYNKRIAQQIIADSFSQVSDSNGNLNEVLSNAMLKIDKLKNLVDSSKDSEWEIHSFCEALEPIPPRDYILDSILSSSSLSVWYGLPGSLKTMVLLDLALSVATGSNWIPSRPNAPKTIQPIKVKKSAVLWLDQDSGNDEIRRRVGPIGKTKDHDNNTPFYWVSFPMPAFLGDEPESIDRIVKYAKKLDVKLIVIDCLNSITGQADENSPQMATVMHGLRNIAEKTGAAVVTIHHSNKSDSKVLRGHSSINGAIDLAMHVERDGPNAQDISIKATKVRQSPIAPIGAYFAYETDDNDPNQLKTACFFGTGKSIEIPEKATDKARHYITQLSPVRMTQSDIIEHLKDTVGQSKVRDVLKEMVADGSLGLEKGQTNSNLYTLLEIDNGPFL